MKLTVTPEEFRKIRKIVGNTKNADVITGFNKIFDGGSDIPVKGTRLPKSGDVVIEIVGQDSIMILGVLESNAGTFGEMLRNDLSLTSVPKWLNFIRTVGEAIKNLF